MMAESNESMVIVHLRDGETLRCPLPPEIDLEAQAVTLDFAEDSRSIDFSQLKAIFYVHPVPLSESDETRRVPPGTLVNVEFADGEKIRGRTPDYAPDRGGFHLYPIDAGRNEKIFVISSAVVGIEIEQFG